MNRTLPRILSVLALFWAAAALAAPQILLFPALGTPDALVVSGRVLKEGASEGSSTFSRNLRLLTTSNWEGAPVELRWGGLTAKTKSGHDGVFEVTFKPTGELASPGFSVVEARVPGAAEKATVRILDPAAPFVVISDFDDTLAVSNVTRKRSLLKAVLFQDADSQPVVEGMPAFYRCLIEDHVPMPGLAVVSGSPHQLAERIGAFLTKKGFPHAGLYLRDLGLDTLEGYKQPLLRDLFKRLDEKVILVGDSGEHDPEIYAQLRDEFPDQVLAIYIHDAGNSANKARFKDMVLFDDGREAAKDALKRGFITKSCYQEKVAPGGRGR